MATETEVDDILASPFDREWTLQGFGMLRTYLDPDEVERLHIWDTDVAVDNVSTIHNHPWDFDSRIVRGDLVNQRYHLDADPDSDPGFWLNAAEIKTGEGGGLIADPRRTFVRVEDCEIYGPGDVYHQDAPEFHESFPGRGCVTVITRDFVQTRDLAVTCWRTGDWVSAEPRPATRAEIEHFVSLALAAVR